MPPDLARRKLVGFLTPSEDDGLESSSPTPKRGLAEPPQMLRANTARYPLNFVLSQHHCLEANEGNPQPTRLPPPVGAAMYGALGERCVVCLTGFGKRFMAERLVRYTQFFQGAHCKLFDAAAFASDAALEAAVAAYVEARDETAEIQLRESKVEPLQWHVDVGRIAAVFSSSDSSRWTGATKASRASIRDLNLCSKLIFVELRSSKSREDESLVESLDESERVRFARLTDFGETVTTHRVRDVQLLAIVKFLTHVHASGRTVYLTRHGQSEYNVLKKIGGNPGLTDKGRAYARWLGRFAATEICDRGRRPARLWTSTMRRAVQTAECVPHDVVDRGDGTPWTQMQHRASRNLDELYAGDCEGMTYDDITDKYGDESFLRAIDKLGYRYPRGESYLDLIARLDPLMHELESYREPLLVVSHQATLRVLYAFLTGKLRADAPKLNIPLHTVIRLRWEPWDTLPTEHRFPFDDDTANLDDGQRHF